MSGFTSTLFTGLLGWVRTVVSFFWSAATASAESPVLRWIADHWILGALILCVIGLAADWVIYMIRWRPYRAWGSFFRRLRQGREDEAEDAASDADSGDMTEEYPEEGEEQLAPYFQSMADEELPEEAESEAWTWDREDNAPGVTEPAVSAAYGVRGLRAGESGPQAADIAEEESDFDRTARFEQAIRPRRRGSRVASLFREGEGDAQYAAPQDLIDQREAYRKPVYPRSWKGRITQQSGQEQE